MPGGSVLSIRLSSRQGRVLLSIGGVTNYAFGHVTNFHEYEMEIMLLAATKRSYFLISYQGDKHSESLDGSVILRQVAIINDNLSGLMKL
jgi:hypothetical protein